MPLPNPARDEDKEEFLHRCMADDTMTGEYPGQDQRYAVCLDLWNRRKNMLSDKSIQGTLKKKEDGKFSIIASTGKVDRDHEVILPKAFKKHLKAYLDTNPVILPAHDYRAFAIGKATDGRVTKTGLELDIEFAETEMGSEARYLYENGFMNSFSVGFIPHKVAKQQETTELLKEEGIDFDEKDPPRLVYKEVELLEVSAVSVPSNAAANVIREAIDGGAKLPLMAKLYCDKSDEVKEEAATTGNVSDQPKPRTKAQQINSYFIKEKKK